MFSYVSCETRVPMGHPLRAIREIVNEAPVVLRAHGAGRRFNLRRLRSDPAGAQGAGGRGLHHLELHDLAERGAF